MALSAKAGPNLVGPNRAGLSPDRHRVDPMGRSAGSTGQRLAPNRDFRKRLGS